MRAPQQAVSTLSMAADGPVCIVTGGSRGLGRAIALKLGGEGCRVVVNYAASAGAAEEVVAEIKKLGGDGVAVQADMSSSEGIKALFKATADAYDEPVGVLVNNAGITRDTLVMRMKEKQWTDVIDTNLNGVFYASQAAAKVCSPLHATRPCTPPGGGGSRRRPDPQPDPAADHDEGAEGPHHQHGVHCRQDRQPRPGQLCGGQGRRHRCAAHTRSWRPSLPSLPSLPPPCSLVLTALTSTHDARYTRNTHSAVSMP